jgi:hypothetical protein
LSRVGIEGIAVAEEEEEEAPLLSELVLLAFDVILAVSPEPAEVAPLPLAV